MLFSGIVYADELEFPKFDENVSNGKKTSGT